MLDGCVFVYFIQVANMKLHVIHRFSFQKSIYFTFFTENNVIQFFKFSTCNISLYKIRFLKFVYYLLYIIYEMEMFEYIISSIL